MTDADMERFRPEIEALCRHHRVGRLDLFGSAATGRDHPGDGSISWWNSSRRRRRGRMPMPISAWLKVSSVCSAAPWTW